MCEGVTCQNGKQISIQEANYGRLDRDTCLHPAMSNINCRASSSLQIVQDKRVLVACSKLGVWWRSVWVDMQIFANQIQVPGIVKTLHPHQNLSVKFRSEV